jgi:DNA-binding response OmpR family regulator
VTHILLVEDDPVLGRGLNVNLELEGYKVQWVKSLHAAADARQDWHFELVILDLGLPDGNGLQLLKQLKTSTNAKESTTPVVILTAQTDEDSVVEGLGAGASDYVRKPFGNRELLARIKAVLREPATQGHQLKYENLVISLDQRRVTYGDNDIELSRREFDLLCHFVQRAEAVVTRDALLQALGKDDEIFDRTIDSHVSHLRARLRKVGVQSIQISSVYGVGYRLEKK